MTLLTQREAPLRKIMGLYLHDGTLWHLLDCGHTLTVPDSHRPTKNRRCDTCRHEMHKTLRALGENGVKVEARP